MAITDALILPADVTIGPVRELSASLRSRLGAPDDAFAISRPRGRAPVKLIAPAGAELLEEFRAARRVSDVILTLAARQGTDADALLLEAFPLLHDCFAARFLVPLDSPDAAPVLPTLEPGDRVGRWRVVRCIRLLSDTELHQARASDGSLAAIKVARGSPTSILRRMFAREAAVLAHLGGRGAPRLLGQGRIRRQPYLAMSWREGVEPGVAFGELRGGRRAELVRLAARLVAAYSRLHARGILHGDVCPENLLIDRRGRVVLLDFGRACFTGSHRTRRDPPRGFVPPFLDPELAAAVAANAPAPPLTPAGEQYAIAALVYSLVTGQHHREFPLDRASMLAEIGCEPLPFSARGAAPWPRLEQILARALSRGAEQRFPSVAAFARALGRVDLPPVSVERAPVAESAGELVAGFIHDLSLGRPLERLTSGAPVASLMYGMAGVAYTLYRLALIRGDATALAAADLWITRGLAEQSRPDAFYRPALGLTPAKVGRVSPYHAASGLHVVDGLIAQALGDSRRYEEAVGRYVAATSAPCAEADLTLGRAGVLIGAALLLDAAPVGTTGAAAALRAHGDAAAHHLCPQPRAENGPARRESRPTSGIAHGLGGILYAALRWSRAAGTSLPAVWRARLGELAAAAEPLGRGVHWPDVRHGAVAAEELPGWCNGPAGLVHLWTLAHRMFGRSDYLTLAESSAWSAWEAPSGFPDLCCGLAGRAYALLNLYRHSGNSEWLARARALGARAAPALGRRGAFAHPLSLFKGAPGILLLLADLAAPEAAYMPFFEAEGWPVADAAG